MSQKHSPDQFNNFVQLVLTGYTDGVQLLIHDYPLPTGYTVEATKLALEIPPDYPGAQIYGFYAYPPLALTSGRTIERTQMRGILLGVEFHGWSRNRGHSAPWNPAMDNVISQLALVDAALAKEVGE